MTVTGSGVGELSHCGRQGDASGAERQACGGARRRAQEKAFPVLFDLSLGQRVEIGEDLGPRLSLRGVAVSGRLADVGDALLQFLLQDEGEKAAGDMAANGFVELVKDRTRGEQAF